MISQSVDTMSKNIDEIGRTCEQMTSRLADTKARTRHLIGSNTQSMETFKIAFKIDSVYFPMLAKFFKF